MVTERIFSKKKLNLDAFLKICIFITTICLLITISYFGNPMHDEAFPFAIAWRFILGQKPFIDDFSPYIGLGFLLVPLIKFSLWLHHGKNELILFMRHIYILTVMIGGLYAYFYIKKYLPEMLAYLLAVYMTVFHPFGINNFHYDTLTVLIWSMVLFQFYNLKYAQETNAKLLFFAILNLLLLMTYPTFIVLLIPFYLLCKVHTLNKTKFWKILFYVFSLFIIFFCYLIFWHYQVKFSDIINTLNFWESTSHISVDNTNNNSGDLTHKLFIILKQLTNHYAMFTIISLILVACSALLKKMKLISALLLLSTLFIPLLLIDNLKASVFVESFYFLNCIGFGAFFVFLFFLNQDLLCKRLFYMIWIPSLLAGFLTSLTSHNLELNFNLGFFPGSLLGLVFIYLAIEKNIFPIENALLSYAFTRSMLIFAFIVIAFFQANYIYGVSATITGLNANDYGLKIYQTSVKMPTDGPFKGLYLDQSWINALTQLQYDIRKIDVDGKFAYFGQFSGGYLLLNHLLPGEYLLYCFYTINHFYQPVKIPNYTIDFSRVALLPKQDIDHYLSGGDYTKLTSNAYYDIYFSIKASA